MISQNYKKALLATAICALSGQSIHASLLGSPSDLIGLADTELTSLANKGLTAVTDAGIELVDIAARYILWKVRNPLGITLINAVKNNDHDMVKQLLEQGVDPNVCDFEDHRTPLYFAVKRSSDEYCSQFFRPKTPGTEEAPDISIVKLLMEHGAKYGREHYGSGDPMENGYRYSDPRAREIESIGGESNKILEHTYGLIAQQRKHAQQPFHRCPFISDIDYSWLSKEETKKTGYEKSSGALNFWDDKYIWRSITF